MSLRKLSFLVLLCFSACLPYSKEYQASYRYFSHKKPAPQMVERGPFVIFLVDARHLDYESTESLLKTMAKHPSDGSKNTDVGHAWIYLKQGNQIFEGGFSAETGRCQPTYLQGVSLLSDRGDPNPCRYLFARQKDGHLERGAGGHRPTYAAKIDITTEDAERIRDFIESYPYESYALSGNSCASFVADIADLIGIHLDVYQTIAIDPLICFRGERVKMWQDPGYSVIKVATPDRLEKSLIELVADGKGEEAMRWWRFNH